MRKTSVRALLAYLQAQGQIGVPPGMSTNASLGFLRMAYQSAIAAMSKREAEIFALIRLEGAAPRPHTAPMTDISRRAKAGFCPCCTQATNVTSPPAYSMGELSRLKSRGLDLREAHGPWAPRRVASSRKRGIGQLSSREKLPWNL